MSKRGRPKKLMPGTAAYLAEMQANLPKLTDYQQNFVMGIMQGLSATDAYKQAYNTENYNNNSIWCEASKLKSDPKVSQWIEYYRLSAISTRNKTVENHLAELESLREAGRANGQIAAAVQAEVSAGKCLGFYEDVLRLKDDSKGTEALQVIAQALGREQAAVIATSLGIDLDELLGESDTVH